MNQKIFSRLLFVATYPEMNEIVERMLSETNSKMMVVSGELHHAIDKLRNLDLSNIEVIISRGGTARLIRKTFHLPVVEVEVGAVDLLRVVYKHREEKMAVIGADNVISEIHALEDVIRLNIEYYPVTFDEEIEPIIQHIHETDVDVIIGDTVSNRIARNYGIATELIRSDIDSVRKAVDKAMRICQAILEEREKNLRLYAMVDRLKEGVLAFDERGELTFINQEAEKLLKSHRESIMGKDIRELIPMIQKEDGSINIEEPIVNQVVKIDGMNRVISMVPILIDREVRGGAVILASIQDIQKTEQMVRQSLAQKGLVAKHNFSDILGKSDSILEAIHTAKRYAKIDSTVLLYGKSGTGKELFAQSIHLESRRKDGPFIAINCATLPQDLLESTLFGYEDGSFTGAKKGGRKGLFEQAHGGTIFLDEIAEAGLDIQAHLLRVIQEHEVMRVGGDRVIPVDVRVIAASNKQLFNEVKEGRFREDLYYRLSVLNVNLPPLKDRVGDVELLVNYFMRVYSSRYGIGEVTVEPGVMKALSDYNWPGNIRQLQNTVQRMVLQSDRGLFREKDLGVLSLEKDEEEEPVINDYFIEGTLSQIISRIVKDILQREKYNKTKTAERLGITRVTLNKYLHDE